MKFLILILLTAQALAAEEIRFPAFGDWGMGNSGQKKIAATLNTHCAKYRCDFVMGLGDNFYPDGVDSTKDEYWQDRYEAIYGGMAVPFMASLGNHDYHGNIQAQIDYSLLSKTWRMPARYFSYARGNAEFYVIDTNDFNEKQQKWLQAGLSKSTAKWTFVYGHHPVYSYGMHGNTKNIEEELLPILTAARANFYIAGHDHDMQVLKAEGGVNFIISGAAAENRGTKKGERTLWRSGQLGFAYFVVGADSTVVRMIDQAGETLYERTYAPHLLEE